MEAWIKEGEKLLEKRRTNQSHYGVLTRLELEHRTHYGEITVFYIRKLLKRRSDFDCSSTIVLKRHSDFKFIKIFIKFYQNWDLGRPKSRSRGVLAGLRQLKAAKPTPGKRLGRAPGSQNGSQGVPGHPKSSQNGTKIESKWSPKPVKNGIRFGVLKNVDLLSIFGSNFYQKTGLNLIDAANRFGAWIDEF